jgi:hypothetical protein
MNCKSGFHVIGSGQVGLIHNNPILGTGQGGLGVGQGKLPRPPGRGGVGY